MKYKRRVKKLAVLCVLLCTTLFCACGGNDQTFLGIKIPGKQITHSDPLHNKDLDGLREDKPMVPKPVEVKPEKLQLSEAESFVDEDDGRKDAGKAPLQSQNLVTGITVTAAGDCSLGNYEGQDYNMSFRQMADAKQDYGYFLSNVYDIFSKDDCTIVNLECVLTKSEEINEGRTYNIKGDPAYARILTEGSVEAVSMANNHRQDFGEKGTKDTIAALQEENIVYAYDGIVGVYEVPDKQIKIGIISVNESSQGQGVEGFVKKGMEKLTEEGADLKIVCCHWGIEREDYPTDYQQALGKKCIDWGADLVVGHHPHVVQGIEEYQGKYIIYSLANFSFGANRNPADKDTFIFQQTFYFEEGTKREETDVKVMPCFVSSVKERNDYCPTPAEGEDALSIMNRLKTLSEPFDVPEAIFDFIGNQQEKLR